MKVSLEGTTEELLDLVELLAIGRTTRHATEVPKNQTTSARDVRVVLGTNVPARDDVPNRFREEGVQ